MLSQIYHNIKRGPNNNTFRQRSKMTSTSKSPSFSSSAMSRRNYGIFLSFRGPDTRNTIVSHLYHALTLKGLYVFKDNEELEAGQGRSELFDAIKGSQVAVVVFSENYARSKWCLDELQKIMECKDQGKLTVIPIFYHISPGEVRMHKKVDGGRGCYLKAMKEMEGKYGKNSETVKRWRKALWEGGDLIGIPLDRGKDEGNVVQEVVKKVLKLLNHVPLEVAKYPVGIGRHVRAIRSLLHIDPHINNVYMIGLLGQGGVGKSTIAKAICNDIADRFDSWCFLPNIRETTSRVFNGLAHLQQTLLCELLSDNELTVSNVDAGKQMIKKRLCNKRVLVILDDVGESSMLDALAENLNWYGTGSRIIITTRNKHVLTLFGVPEYEVNLLRKEEAENLFRLHAFGEQKKINVDGGLIDSFVKYAGELPLALVVLGAFLRGRSESQWKGKLKELAKSPDTTINSVLKISFDGLEKSHKEIFLDVACFYKGWHVNHVNKILDSCGFASSGISFLEEQCLVTIINGKIQMHDLLVVMGQSIVCENGKISRIWLYNDFLDILAGDREKQAVTGIVLTAVEEDYKVLFESNALMGFKNLRVLIVRHVFSAKEPVQLPRELRWLEWPGYSAQALELDPSSKLVGLYFWLSNIPQIKLTGFKELKYLNLSSCRSIRTISDLSKCQKLEDLNLCGCVSLRIIDEDIGTLQNLVQLNLCYCVELIMVPSSLRSKRLKTLDFHGCYKLKIPPIIEEFPSLELLDLSKTAIKQLPDSIGNLVALKKLYLFGCKELTTIPSSIYKIQTLEELELEDCPKLSGFPRRAAGAATDVIGFPNLVQLRISFCMLKDLEFLDDLTCLDTLMSMHLSGNMFIHVPASISKFKNLKLLWLYHCFRLVKVMELPNVSDLRVAKCRWLKTFPSLHTFICQSSEKIMVDFTDCHSLDLGYIDRSLPLEHVRWFVRQADVFFPGGEFPHWVNFQSKECNSCYFVSLPPNMSTYDLLGLALFISFGSIPLLPQLLDDHPTIRVRVNGVTFLEKRFYSAVVGVHSWFLYIPCQSLVWHDRDFATELNRQYITLQFSTTMVHLDSWGMRLLCKREQDDGMIMVDKDRY